MLSQPVNLRMKYFFNCRCKTNNPYPTSSGLVHRHGVVRYHPVAVVVVAALTETPGWPSGVGVMPLAGLGRTRYFVRPVEPVLNHGEKEVHQEESRPPLEEHLRERVGRGQDLVSESRKKTIDYFVGSSRRRLRRMGSKSGSSRDRSPPRRRARFKLDQVPGVDPRKPVRAGAQVPAASGRPRARRDLSR